MPLSDELLDERGPPIARGPPHRTDGRPRRNAARPRWPVPATRLRKDGRPPAWALRRLAAAGPSQMRRLDRSGAHRSTPRTGADHGDDGRRSSTAVSHVGLPTMPPSTTSTLPRDHGTYAHARGPLRAEQAQLAPDRAERLLDASADLMRMDALETTASSGGSADPDGGHIYGATRAVEVALWLTFAGGGPDPSADARGRRAPTAQASFFDVGVALDPEARRTASQFDAEEPPIHRQRARSRTGSVRAGDGRARRPGGRPERPPSTWPRSMRTRHYSR